MKGGRWFPEEKADRGMEMGRYMEFSSITRGETKS